MVVTLREPVQNLLNLVAVIHAVLHPTLDVPLVALVPLFITLRGNNGAEADGQGTAHSYISFHQRMKSNHSTANGHAQHHHDPIKGPRDVGTGLVTASRQRAVRVAREVASVLVWIVL